LKKWHKKFWRAADFFKMQGLALTLPVRVPAEILLPHFC